MFTQSASLKIFVTPIIPFFCGESKGRRKSVTKKATAEDTQIFCRGLLNPRHRHGYYHHLILPPTNELPRKILQLNAARSMP